MTALTSTQRRTALVALEARMVVVSDRDRELVRQVYEGGVSAREASTTREIHRTQMAEIRSAIEAIKGDAK